MDRSMISLTPTDDDARAFALARHGEQRYGDEPYIVHLTAVRQVCADFEVGGDIAVAAWLHDTVEDTDTDCSELEARFGVHVADLVWAVTGVGKTRVDRVRDMLRKIRRAGRDAVKLKLADRIANVEASVAGGGKTAALLAMYREEQPALADAVWEVGTDITVRRMLQRLQRALDTGRRRRSRRRTA
jgi:hypothetical protein